MKKLRRFALLFAFGSSSLLWCDTAYSSSYDFETAVASSTQQLENFGTLTPGQSISNGQTVDGIKYVNFNLSGGAGSGYVTDGYNSLSGLSLGANHGAQQFFFGGDSFQIQFSAPITALGILFNVNLNSGTFGFTTPTSSSFTTSSVYDNNTFVFAGLISSTPFQRALISSVGSQASFNVPAIISVATPEPSSWMLGLTGVVGLCLLAAVKRSSCKA